MGIVEAEIEAMLLQGYTRKQVRSEIKLVTNGSVETLLERIYNRLYKRKQRESALFAEREKEHLRELYAQDPIRRKRIQEYYRKRYRKRKKLTKKAMRDT